MTAWAIHNIKPSMEMIGKNVDVYLSTPLFPVASYSANDLKKVRGKIMDHGHDGFWIQISQIGEAKNLPKFPFQTVFIPTHKIDFMGVTQ